MRKKTGKRGLVKISTRDLIMPYFVIGGNNKREPVKSMPGIARVSVDCLLKDIRKGREAGIRTVILFGVCPPGYKDSEGSYAYSPGNVIPFAISAIKRRFSDITVITDVCLCAYTSHGHCGVIRHKHSEAEKQIIDKERTLDALGRMAVLHAQAGADWIGPSAMAARQVAVIRKALDKNGYRKTRIMGYSAKFVSNFYGPFRYAADSAPKFGNRSSYQLNFADASSALKEIKDDIREGADMVMVKPALSYLDVIRQARLKFHSPLAAYNVSGEYAFVKFGARLGLWHEKQIVFEILTSIKRAGADFIITYHANEAARWLKEK